MPYITCPDGHTYSRYDQSDYVKACICEETARKNSAHYKCMKDPKCRAEYEAAKAREPYLIVGCLLIMFTLIVLFVRHLEKLTNGRY